MAYLKINSYTRVLDDGKKTIEERKQLFNEHSISKSENYQKEEKRNRPVDQNKKYEKFVKEVFRERTFISKPKFNRLILAKFSSNSTYYRKRMIELHLIKEENNLIKLWH